LLYLAVNVLLMMQSCFYMKPIMPVDQSKKKRLSRPNN
jgi:hypothetical protein